MRARQPFNFIASSDLTLHVAEISFFTLRKLSFHVKYVVRNMFLSVALDKKPDKYARSPNFIIKACRAPPVSNIF